MARRNDDVFDYSLQAEWDAVHRGDFDKEDRKQYGGEPTFPRFKKAKRVRDARPVENAAIYSETRNEIARELAQAAIEVLSPDETTFMLLLSEGYTVKQICNEYGMTVRHGNDIKKRIARKIENWA